MRAIVVTALTVITAGLLAATPAQAATPRYTTGDEWGLWPVVHTTTISCDNGDRLVGWTFSHGREFIKKVTVTRASATFTLAAGDPEVYDSAVGVTITCLDLA